jgi:hypothetical protein
VKKKALTFAMVTVTVLVILSFSFNIRTAKAADSSDYTIESVNHTIEVLYNGYVFINDTIQISGQASNGFLLGFPYIYGSHVLRSAAYNLSDVFPVILDVPLENHVGFYWVKINFPQGTPQMFTVGFILSNNLVSENISNKVSYILGFPAYPSLTKTATVCNVSISLPEDATYVRGTVSAFNYSKQNLPEFTYAPANVTFTLSTSNDKIKKCSIKELKSEVEIGGTGEIDGSDSYYVVSESIESISSIEIVLPPNAFSLSVQDEFGRTMSQPTVADAQTNRYEITFTSSVESYRSTRFTVKYQLPSNYTTQMGTSNFNVTFPLFRHVNNYIELASVTLVLPEGARMSSFEIVLTDSECNIDRGVFQETVTIDRESISPLDGDFPSENILQIMYEYNPLWVSFRSTLWMWALAIVGCVVTVVWKRPKSSAYATAPALATRLRPEFLKSFVDAYEEKRKATSELESLENRVHKGKIPRRRYKVQRKTLETRVGTLSRNLAEFKEKMYATRGQYAELMRQLEIAETEINEVEVNIKSIEARHNRGEISLETYRKLLSDYQRKKEGANTTINGILLRLREEIR